MNRLALIVIWSAVISGCGAGRVRIEPRQFGDNKLTCAEIKQQIEDTKTKADHSAKSVSTGRQFWRSAMFPLSAAKAQSNSTAFIDEANKRIENLFALSDKQGCNL